MEVKGADLSAIFAENTAAKIVQVAQRGLKQQVGLILDFSEHIQG